MDDPNITMKEYIRLEEEKARRNGKVYNWETATYGRIWDDNEVYNLKSVETKFPAIVFDDTFTSHPRSSHPTSCPLYNAGPRTRCLVFVNESDCSAVLVAAVVVWLWGIERWTKLVKILGQRMENHSDGLVRCVRNPDVMKESVGGDVRLAEDVVEQAPHTGEQSILADQQVCIDREAVNRPDVGPKNTMVSDTSRCTNVAPIELNKSSTVTLPKAALDEVNARFVNTLYGFPVGKKLAFPMVENYVKHAWVKFGLKRVMMHCGSFMFQFESKSGMEKVLESGPWRIQLVPFVLKVWLPNTLLKKDKVTNVPLWEKCITEYTRALVEVSAEVPLVDSVDLDIPLEDGKGYTMVKIRIEYEWQPPRCGTCKIFDHLESVCPRKRMAGPVVKCVKHAHVKKDKRPMHAIGNKDKGIQVSTQRYIKGYHVNIPKTKLVYRAVVKPQSDNHVTSNMEDTTKQPSPSDSSKNGMTYINDDLSLDELRNFVNQKAEEESVIEFIGNNTNDGCTLRGKQDDKISSKKPSSSLEVINEDSDTDVDEVLLPDIGTSFPSSSFGGGQSLEKEILNAYDDDYEDQFEEYPSSYEEFCDQFDFKVKGRGRN
ncbi:zinc knuckle CX2CX4HX4C containing protein [Tanacetum coccineum]